MSGREQGAGQPAWQLRLKAEPHLHGWAGGQRPRSQLAHWFVFEAQPEGLAGGSVAAVALLLQVVAAHIVVGGQGAAAEG